MVHELNKYEPEARERDEFRSRWFWILEDDLRHDNMLVDGLLLLPLIQAEPGVLVGLPAHQHTYLICHQLYRAGILV